MGGGKKKDYKEAKGKDTTPQIHNKGRMYIKMYIRPLYLSNNRYRSFPYIKSNRHIRKEQRLRLHI